jgi:hypothetical protein
VLLPSCSWGIHAQLGPSTPSSFVWLVEDQNVARDGQNSLNFEALVEGNKFS